jgi:antitoxin (DNA-binding transcriptional repressor) of toxin-antitoxin stability system
MSSPKSITVPICNSSTAGRLCHDEPVIVTVNGIPSFQLVPLEEGDDLIDRLLEHNPKFGRTLESRLRERSVSLKDAEKLLK